MIAAAKEYRETLAIERTLQEDPEKGYKLLKQEDSDVSLLRMTSEYEEGQKEEARSVVLLITAMTLATSLPVPLP